MGDTLVDALLESWRHLAQECGVDLASLLPIAEAVITRLREVHELPQTGMSIHLSNRAVAELLGILPRYDALLTGR